MAAGFRASAVGAASRLPVPIGLQQLPHTGLRAARPHTLSSWRPATGMGGRLHYGEHAGMRRREGSISSRAAITPKRHTPSKKKVKKQVYCGTPGCTDEWNGNAPRRVRIIMIRIKNRAVERLHHDAFFCFFFSFSSFSFSISATYFSISSGFNIYQREFKVSLQAMRAAPEEGRPLAADDQKVDGTPQLGTALQGAKGMWERRHHGGWSAGSPPGACAAPPTLMPAEAAAGAAITLRGWSRLMIASSMFLPPD